MTEQIYVRRSPIPASVEALYRWHARPGALERLVPPWQEVRVLERAGRGLEEGSRVRLRARVHGVPTEWLVEHRDVVPGRQFRDVQLRGPFARWEHAHRFEPGPGSSSALEDEVRYALPLGALGAAVGGSLARQQLDRLFRYRHTVTAWDLERHRLGPDAPWTVAISGATGLLGEALTSFLTTGGHTVLRLTRGGHHPAPGARDVHWDPAAGRIDAAALEGVDAVIHLAGENVGVRWTPERRRRIRESRVRGTRLLAETLAALERRPRVLISVSGVGIYGDRGDALLGEDAGRGEGFLADVGEGWEAAADPARAAGIRVVHPRLGVVLTPRGGALQRMLLPFQLGGGGRIGSGMQWWSWISIEDVIGAFHHALITDSLAGPVNVVSPSPVLNQQFVETLGRVLGRPTLLPVPATALTLLFGEMAEEALLASQRVVPRRLLATGYRFRHPELEGALRFVLGR